MAQLSPAKISNSWSERSPCTARNTILAKGESRARLEMVVIRPAGGSPVAKLELAIVLGREMKNRRRGFIYTLEVDNYERGQWSNGQWLYVQDHDLSQSPLSI